MSKVTDGPMQAAFENLGVKTSKSNTQLVWEWLKDHPHSTSSQVAAVYRFGQTILSQLENRKMISSFTERRRAADHRERMVKVYKVIGTEYELLPMPEDKKTWKKQVDDRAAARRARLIDAGTAHKSPAPTASAARYAGGTTPPPQVASPVLQAAVDQSVQRLLGMQAQPPAPVPPPPPAPVPEPAPAPTLAGLSMDEKVEAIVDGLSVREGRMLLDRLKELFG